MNKKESLNNGGNNISSKSDMIVNNEESNKTLKRLHSLLDQTTQYTLFVNQDRIDNMNSVSKRRRIDDTHNFNSLINGGILRPYQIDGVRWLISLYENGLNGILADQMGLGKTIMLITFVTHLRTNGVHGPILICAPLSTLPQWQNEFERWSPNVKTFIYHGDKEKRHQLRKEYLSNKRRKNHDDENKHNIVVITSYSIAMSDCNILKRFHWKYLVIDEGHRLKNYECKLLKDLKKLHSDNRLLLTGTPLQNNLTELWSLLNFLLPDIFDSLNKFENWFNFDEKTLEEKQHRQILLDEEKNNQIISKLHGILRPFILRRVKTDVLKDLPRKREIVLVSKLTPIQKSYYTAIINHEKHKLPHNFSFHNELMQLRKVCNHPYLIKDSDDTNEDIITSCGKLQLIDQLLKELKKKNHRVLIFSQMTKVLDILEDYLVFRDYEYCRFDGSSSSEERQDEVYEFNHNSDKFVFLLSTRSGGLGINLVSADSVIIYDSDWNPHADQQATDRAHRIGQKKDVLVFRLITSNLNEENLESVEIKMLSRALSKKRLEQLVIGKGNLLGLQLECSDVDRWQGTVKPLNIKQLEEELLISDIPLQTNQNIQKYQLPNNILEHILNRDRDSFTNDGMDKLDNILSDYGFVLKPNEVLADAFVE